MNTVDVERFRLTYFYRIDAKDKYVCYFIVQEQLHKA